MSMIVIGHFFKHAITRIALPDGVYQYALAYLDCGVNLFFMISGWFLARGGFKSILRLIILIVCFDIINIGLCLAFKVDISFKTIVMTLLFPISKSQYWFIQVYFLMLITAPLINAGLKSFNLQQLRRFVAIFTLVTVYSCGLGHNICNPSGYSYIQGVYMYCVAYYLRQDNRVYSAFSQPFCFFVYIGLLAIAGTAFYLVGSHIFVAYNSIFLIISSASLLILFSRIDFQSRFVNALAGSALGCYLLQDGLFGFGYMYKWLHTVYLQTDSIPVLLGIFFGVFIFLWVFSAVITCIVKRLERMAVGSVEKFLPETWLYM